MNECMKMSSKVVVFVAAKTSRETCGTLKTNRSCHNKTNNNKTNSLSHNKSVNL